MPAVGKIVVAPNGRPGIARTDCSTGVVTILNQIYEVDFKGISYGFRPGRNPHQALDALAVGIQGKRVSWWPEVAGWMHAHRQGRLRRRKRVACSSPTRAQMYALKHGGKGSGVHVT